MSIETLPDELLIEIFERVPGAHKMYNISRQFHNIVEDIKQRAHKNPEKYIESLSNPVSFLLSDPKYHKAIWDKAVDEGNLYLIVELDKLGYKFNADTDLVKSAKKGHEHLVRFFGRKGSTSARLAFALAIKMGYVDIAKLFIKNSDHMKEVLESMSKPRFYYDIWSKAIKEDNLYLITELVNLGYKFNTFDIRDSVEMGYKDLVEFFVSKTNKFDALDDGMGTAAYTGNKDLVNLFIEHGAGNWNEGLESAIRGGHKDLVEFFIDQGANNLDWCLELAATEKNKDLIDLLIERGATDMNGGMAGAAYVGDQDLVNFFIENGADDMNIGMAYAAMGGREDLQEFFRARGGHHDIDEYPL